MNILIVGAGEVGGHLAKLLSREKHDITVIDKDPAKIARISESLDVMALEGWASSPTLLREAGIEKADMVIAVTAVDEVNILVGMIANRFNVKTKIARVRNREFSDEGGFLSSDLLGIDQIIHPELEAMREIVRLIRYPQAMEIITFCEEEIVIAGIKLLEGSPFIGKKLMEIAQTQEKLDFRIVAINRNFKTIIPRGNHSLEIGDEIFVSCMHNHLPRIFELTGHKEGATRHVMIYGATSIGMMVAEELGRVKEIEVKLIERDKEHGWEAAEELPHSTVVIGEASDIDLLAREGIGDQDVFVAVTDDDEDNIVTSLLARHLEVNKTITLIGKADYIPIVKTIGLDLAVNTRQLTSNAIFKYIRTGKIRSLRHMVSVDAETIEFSVSANSKVVGKQIKDIKFPEGSIVVAVEHSHGCEIPIGDTKMFVGDSVVIFCLPQAVQATMKLFE
ncbi:Trk system potassium transporter TrkA [bacterium]|nr:Trk system potassium transporter TrkA [bacterium]